MHSMFRAGIGLPGLAAQAGVPSNCSFAVAGVEPCPLRATPLAVRLLVALLVAGKLGPREFLLAKFLSDRGFSASLAAEFLAAALLTLELLSALSLSGGYF